MIAVENEMSCIDIDGGKYYFSNITNVFQILGTIILIEKIFSFLWKNYLVNEDLNKYAENIKIITIKLNNSCLAKTFEC